MGALGGRDTGVESDRALTSATMGSHGQLWWSSCNNLLLVQEQRLWVASSALFL